MMEDDKKPAETTGNQSMDEMKNDPAADPAIDLSGAEKQAVSPEEKIAELSEQLAAAKDQALRSLAELENFRNRKNRELAELRKYESMSLARDILPSGTIWDARWPPPSRTSMSRRSSRGSR